MAISREPSFIVAPGDPGALNQAADWHEQTATGLTQHASTISQVTAATLPQWQGDAAGAYATLASDLVSSFQVAGRVSAANGAIYRSCGRMLEEYQRIGNDAMKQALHWCNEVTTESGKVTDAQGAVTRAQTAVTTAQQTYTTALGQPALAGGAVVAAGRALGVAQGQLRQAQGDLRRAQHALEHAERQVDHYDRLGTEAFHDAEHAVATLTGLHIDLPVPPMPSVANMGVPDLKPLSPTPPPGLTPPHHSSSLFGDILGIIQTGASITSTISGGCAMIMFWNPIGDGCGVVAGVSGGVSAADGLLQYATGNGSAGAAAVETLGAVGGFGASAAIRSGNATLRSAAEGGDVTHRGGFNPRSGHGQGHLGRHPRKAARRSPRASGSKSVASILNGLGATASAGSSAPAAKRWLNARFHALTTRQMLD